MPVAKPNPLLATAERTAADGEKEEAGAPSVLLFAHGPSAAAAGSPAASAREARAPPA